MFQLTELKAALSKVKSGADFPKYVQDIKKLGVVKYENFVADGHTLFFGEDNFQLQSDSKYPALDIATKGDAEKFKNYLKIHQEGQTSYPEFCAHAAETGIEKWTVDIHKMTCTYYDRPGEKMLEEQVPEV